MTGNTRLSWIWLPLTTSQIKIKSNHFYLLHHTTAAHHPWTASPIIHCTHTFPSTITPITQLSPITYLPWLSHHTCTSFTHTHLRSTLPCKLCEVLFSTVWHFQAFSLSVFPWTAYTTLTVCCLPSDPACRLISSLSAACPDLCIAPVADSALPSLHLLLSLNLACLTSSCSSIKLHLDLTTLPLHYNSRAETDRNTGDIMSRPDEN